MNGNKTLIFDKYTEGGSNEEIIAFFYNVVKIIQLNDRTKNLKKINLYQYE